MADKSINAVAPTSNPNAGSLVPLAVPGSGGTFTDGTTTLQDIADLRTINSTELVALIQVLVGAGSNIEVTNTPTGITIGVSGLVGTTLESVYTHAKTIIRGSTNITVTPDDSNNTLTISVTGLPVQATTSTAGIAELATNAESITATNADKISTPAGVAAYVTSLNLSSGGSGGGGGDVTQSEFDTLEARVEVNEGDIDNLTILPFNINRAYTVGEHVDIDGAILIVIRAFTAADIGFTNVERWREHIQTAQHATGVFRIIVDSETHYYFQGNDRIRFFYGIAVSSVTLTAATGLPGYLYYNPTSNLLYVKEDDTTWSAVNDVSALDTRVAAIEARDVRVYTQSPVTTSWDVTLGSADINIGGFTRSRVAYTPDVGSTSPDPALINIFGVEFTLRSLIFTSDKIYLELTPDDTQGLLDDELRSATLTLTSGADTYTLNFADAVVEALSGAGVASAFSFDDPDGFTASEGATWRITITEPIDASVTFTNGRALSSYPLLAATGINGDKYYNLTTDFEHIKKNGAWLRIGIKHQHTFTQQVTHTYENTFTAGADQFGSQVYTGTSAAFSSSYGYWSLIGYNTRGSSRATNEGLSISGTDYEIKWAYYASAVNKISIGFSPASITRGDLVNETLTITNGNDTWELTDDDYSGEGTVREVKIFTYNTPAGETLIGSGDTFSVNVTAQREGEITFNDHFAVIASELEHSTGEKGFSYFNTTNNRFYIHANGFWHDVTSAITSVVDELSAVVVREATIQVVDIDSSMKRSSGGTWTASTGQLVGGAELTIPIPEQFRVDISTITLRLAHASPAFAGNFDIALHDLIGRTLTNNPYTIASLNGSRTVKVWRNGNNVIVKEGSGGTDSGNAVFIKQVVFTLR